jgi:hypothetical protein
LNPSKKVDQKKQPEKNGVHNYQTTGKVKIVVVLTGCYDNGVGSGDQNKPRQRERIESVFEK